MADSAAAPRPQSASLDIDDDLSDAAESPRNDACINWPSRRRRRRSPRPAPTAVLVRTALGTVAAAAAGLGHASFKRSDLYGVADRARWRSCAGYDERDFAAVAAATVGFPAAWFCFAGAGSAAARIGSLPLLMVLAAGALATSALAYRDASAILRCSVLWCDAAADDEASNYATTVALMLLIGGFSAFLLFAGLALRVARRRSTPSTTLTEPLLDETEAGPPEPLPATATYPVAWTAALLVALALLLLLTAVLPNSWQGFTATGIAKYRRTAPGSMVDQWTRAAPEGRKAWFRTGFFEVSQKLTLKVYPDVALYYAFLMVLALVACAGRVSPRVGRLLRRRLRTGSVGEGVALGLFSLLLVAFGRYAFVDHQYASDPSKSRWEVLARGAGQCANLGLALLLLPVARRSMIAEAFGLAWEQLLWAHIWVGYATLLLFVVHALCWYKVYTSLHIFPEDVLEVPMYYPTNGRPKSAGRCSDDWTVPLATITTVLALLFLGVLSHHQVRRNHFEVFYYTHHFFIAVYAVALWHAASCWYLVIGSLVHAFADRMVRLSEAGRRWRVVRLEPCFDGVVHLELALLDSAFAFEAGQYCFLKVGCISDLEWHPFTLSGAPSDRRIHFDIKAMGSEGTFVARLRRLAEDRVDAATLDVAIEGPYGCAPTYAHYDSVLLVAGGIGVTPCHAMFRELYIRAAAGHDGPETVTLLWVARYRRCFELYGATLRAAANDDAFRLALYVDGEKPRDSWGEADVYQGIPFTHGRPDVSRAVADLAACSSPYVFVCGPPGLSAACAAAALEHDVAFHSEVFAF